MTEHLDCPFCGAPHECHSPYEAHKLDYIALHQCSSCKEWWKSIVCVGAGPLCFHKKRRKRHG